MNRNNPISVSKDNRFYFLGVLDLKLEKLNIQIFLEADLFIEHSGDKLQIRSLGSEKRTLIVAAENGKKIKKELILGEVWEFTFKK